MLKGIVFSMNTAYQNALDTLKERLKEVFTPEAVSDVILFGSVANGKDTVASDIDVMIILDNDDKIVDWDTEKKVRAIAFDIELSHDVVFDLKVMDRKMLRSQEGHTPFVEKVLTEGISA